jgi:hypothetical protein
LLWSLSLAVSLSLVLSLLLAPSVPLLQLQLLALAFDLHPTGYRTDCKKRCLPLIADRISDTT